MVDTGQEEETFDLLEIGMDLFSYESPASLEFEQKTRSYGTPNLQDEIAEPISFFTRQKRISSRDGMIGHNNLHESDREFIFNEWILDSYDVDEEYAREIGDLCSRRFNEYNRMFKNEIENLSNEYILDLERKGYRFWTHVVWEKCQQNYKKTNEAWHDEAYEEDEMWHIGDEKTDYDPPYVNIETFEVKKYSFKGGHSFICITDHEDEALPLGRVNGARFKGIKSLWEDRSIEFHDLISKSSKQ
ncbi:hypothetical protein Tco_0295018 [Tanacetum coccineum]